MDFQRGERGSHTFLFCRIFTAKRRYDLVGASSLSKDFSSPLPILFLVRERGGSELRKVTPPPVLEGLKSGEIERDRGPFKKSPGLFFDSAISPPPERKERREVAT